MSSGIQRAAQGIKSHTRNRDINYNRMHASDPRRRRDACKPQAEALTHTHAQPQAEEEHYNEPHGDSPSHTRTRAIRAAQGLNEPHEDSEHQLQSYVRMRLGISTTIVCTHPTPGGAGMAIKDLVTRPIPIGDTDIRLTPGKHLGSLKSFSAGRRGHKPVAYENNVRVKDSM